MTVDEAVQALQGICRSCGRGTRSGPAAGDYVRLRRALLADTRIKVLLPDFVRSHRSLEELWPALQAVGGYRDRDRFVWDGFRALLQELEAPQSPAAELAREALGRISEEWVERHWLTALQRRHQDPAGAITAARSFLEDVCRHVLDERSESHSPKDDLPNLYRRAARALNLGADQHDREDLKQILGGCSSVVQGLAAVRNRMGDAHGSGGPLRPAPRHAALAVNLAAAMSTFLLATLGERGSRSG